MGFSWFIFPPCCDVAGLNVNPPVEAHCMRCIQRQMVYPEERSSALNVYPP
jgi:hypothetical protein